MTNQLTQEQMEEVQLQHMTKRYVDLLGVDEDIAETMAVNARDINYLGEVAAQEAFYESKYGRSFP
jgi:hypothetical protein